MLTGTADGLQAPSAVFQRNHSSDVANLARPSSSFSHLSEAVRTANRPHVIWQLSRRRVSTPRDLCNVCGRRGSRMRSCITVPSASVWLKKKKKNLICFWWRVSHRGPAPTLDMCRTVNRPRPTSTEYAQRDSDACTCTSYTSMIAGLCVLKPRYVCLYIITLQRQQEGKDVYWQKFNPPHHSCVTQWS